MQRVQFFPQCEVRKVRERRYHAAGRWDLRDECVLACALRPAFEPIGVSGNDAGEKRKLRNRTSDDDEPRNGAWKGRKFPTIDSRNRFNRCNPKQWEQWRAVMKVNHPLRRAPGQEMLEQDWRGDQNPAWPQQRQTKEWKEETPNKISVSKRF